MPGSPATPTTRPLDRRNQRWLPHNAGKSVPPPPRRYRGWPARNLPRHSTIAVGQLTLAPVKQPQPPRSLGSAAFPQRATAHTVGQSGRPSCIVAAQYISLRLNDTSCVRAEIEPYARCAPIDAGGSPGVFVAVCRVARCEGLHRFPAPRRPRERPTSDRHPLELGPGSAVVDRDCREDNYR